MLRLVVAVLLLVPGAAGAMTMTASVEPPAGGIEPGVDSVPFTLHIALDCQDVLVYRLQAPINEFHILLSVGSADPSIQVSGTFNVILPQAACLDGATEFVTDHAMSLSLHPRAPGLQQLTMAMNAWTEYPTAEPIQGAPEASTRFTVSANYVAQLQVALEEKIIEAPEPTTISMLIGNLGNAQTVVAMGVTQISGTDASAAELFDLPSNIILNAERSGFDFEEVIEIDWRPPPGRWDQIAVTFSFTPVAFLDSEQRGDPTNVNMLIRNDALGRTVPGPGPLLVVGVIVIACLARRLA